MTADLIADGLLVGGLVLSIAEGNSNGAISGLGDLMMLGGLAAIPFAAPGVHISHGEPGRALASLALRTAGPFAGFLLGGIIMDGRCSGGSSVFSCEFDYMVYGGLAAVVAVQVFDSKVLGRGREAQPPQPKPSSPLTAGLRWQPSVGVSPKGTPSFGVAGSW